MFSVFVFTSVASSEIALIEEGSNSRTTPSASKRATYCLIKADLGWVNIFIKSFVFSLSNSTLIGNLPCNSGIISEGVLIWKAPAAINKIWSVETTPYFVFTLLPSTIGNKSLCTPSLLTSGPCPPFPLTTLSISSIKIIPLFSTLSLAMRMTSSLSINF